MAEEDGVEVGFEEGMLWLPTHVLDDASVPKEYLSLRNQRQPQKGLLPQPNPSLKPHHHQNRPRNKIHPTKWAAAGGRGSGMQAIFLDSGQRSCGGTGVFLPQRSGTNIQPTKKPACSPVLLPSRVIQALNLNVHELGLQIKPPRDANNGSQRVDRDAMNNKKGKDASAQCCVISQSRSANSSPEIFLPKEWTY